MKDGVGWFGVPGAWGVGSTKTHAVRDGHPICGSKIGPRKEFQYCGTLDAVRPECVRCQLALLRQETP
jgi:hypothetical protein